MHCPLAAAVADYSGIGSCWERVFGSAGPILFLYLFGRDCSVIVIYKSKSNPFETLNFRFSNQKIYLFLLFLRISHSKVEIFGLNLHTKYGMLYSDYELENIGHILFLYILYM